MLADKTVDKTTNEAVCEIVNANRESDREAMSLMMAGIEAGLIMAGADDGVWIDVDCQDCAIGHEAKRYMT